jgi:hypothetical protein
MNILKLIVILRIILPDLLLAILPMAITWKIELNLNAHIYVGYFKA